MCGMCGLLGGPAHWSESPADSLRRRRQRILQIAQANRLLKHFRLELQDFHGQSYQLTGPTGARELVTDFGALWAAAERLLGQPVDPLRMPWSSTRDGA